MKFEKSYVICATPRTGSTLLGDILETTDLAGRPWEFFSLNEERELRKEWKVDGFKEYFYRAIAEGTTPNGVFGFKIMMCDFTPFIEKLQGIAVTEYETLQEYELLHHFFPDLRYIWMTRRNKVRQAVSFARAVQTKIWAQPANQPEVPQNDERYVYSTIDILMQRVVIFEARWQEYFARNNIKPMIVFYEDFVDSYQETVMQVMRFIGVEARQDLILRKRMQKQSDQLSEIWVERFIREKGAAFLHDQPLSRALHEQSS